MSRSPLPALGLLVLLPALLAAQTTTRPDAATTIRDRLGLEFAVASSILRRNLVSSDDPHGFAIASVAKGSPADLAALAPGQVVMKIDGQPFRALSDLAAALLRPGAARALRLECARRKPEPKLLDRRPWEEFTLDLVPAAPLEPPPAIAPDALVLARIVQVHPSPGVWCGIVVVRQEVTYRIERVLQGKVPPREVRLGHLLVANSPLVLRDDPALAPEWFWPGAPVLLALREHAGAWQLAADERGPSFLLAPRTADPTTEALLRLLLARKELDAYLTPAHGPLAIALSETLPVPVAAERAGQRVRCLPQELLAGTQHLRLDALRLTGTGAELGFALPREGVSGWLRATRTGQAWTVDKVELTER